MSMTPEQIRLKQNPVLSNLLLGYGQGSYIAETLFPRLPTALRGFSLPRIGNERFQKYQLRRAPGAATKRIDIHYDGQTYTVNQYSVDVPIPRELIEESEAAARFNLTANLDISRIAMKTASEVLLLDYEIEAAELALAAAGYPASNTLAFTSTTKWSAATGTPVTDIRTASDVVRAKVGKRPNRLIVSTPVLRALEVNAQIKTYFPSTHLGPATMSDLTSILGVDEIVVGDAVWRDGDNDAQDVWGNAAILAYAPAFTGGSSDISLAEPAFGFTSVLEGHPFAEPPRYDADSKSWIYGATYERLANIVTPEAGFLFQSPI
jgi:hypothetical protein